MKNNQDNNIEKMRHSCAHLLAAAVLELNPDTKVAIGPAIENGFYYDFDFGNQKISEEDFPKIEEKMHELLKKWNKMEMKEVTEEKARELFSNNEFKLQLIDDFKKEKQQLTVCISGNFTDLCRGGHIDNPSKELQYFKLLSIAGAYWKGSEKNPMLTRIYGTCFPTQKELNEHLKMLEEAKKRDHRKIGEKLGIFTISEEVGQGLVLWLPNGTIIKEELEKFGKETETKWGYKRVATPNITKSGLYYTSGHLPYYKDDMYPPMKGEKDEEYYLKPMNCPHHHMVYKARPKSYRDLPLRYAEFGTCYRYEASGELYGMMRVRGFTQNDAHIYCTIEQAVDEFVKVMQLHEYYYKIFEIKDYHLELGLRDPKKKDKYHGDEKMWNLAEKLMREAVKKTNIKMVEQEGSAAFYGPKIDFIIHTVTGKEYATSTNQIDLYMGQRFGLKYIDSDGKEQVPVVIHRAPLGSDERFVGFLIEHYAGDFPLWLSPIQIVIIPIADRHKEGALKIADELKENEVRVEIDDRPESMQSKIRDHSLQKVPYLGIIGDKELASNNKAISIRTREGKDLGQIAFSNLLEKLKNEIDKKT